MRRHGLPGAAVLQIGWVFAFASLFVVPSLSQPTAIEGSPSRRFMPRYEKGVRAGGRVTTYHVFELPLASKRCNGEAVHVGEFVVSRSQLLRIENASDHYTKLIQLNPDDVWALTMRALARFKLDRQSTQAMKDLDEAIRRSPNYAPAYDLRGSVLCEDARFELAVQDHEQALRIDPNSAYSWLGRGIVCLESRVFHQAIDDFSEAIRLNPKLAVAYAKRAESFAGICDHHSAIADYTSAISLDPLSAEAFYNRSQAFWMIGDSRHGQDDYRKGQRLNPDGPPMRVRVFLIR